MKAFSVTALVSAFRAGRAALLLFFCTSRAGTVPYLSLCYTQMNYRVRLHAVVFPEVFRCGAGCLEPAGTGTREPTADCWNARTGPRVRIRKAPTAPPRCTRECVTGCGH